MIAALFVAANGCYFGLPDVDPWDETRDARTYAGPWPVVAHPPCQRWGRYWYGGPSVRVRKVLGDDAGCFAAAIAAVRRWGGVLEHPEATHAWRAHSLIPPLRGGGWSVADDHDGWTCCVEQGHYGHRARKATWLYAVGCYLPRLKWGSSQPVGPRIDEGFHSAEERRMFMRPPANMSPEWREKRRRWLERREASGFKVHCGPERMAMRERMATPVAFRDLLLGIARSVKAPALEVEHGQG